MDSREQVRTERRGGLLSRLRPGEPEPPGEGIEGLLRAVKAFNAKADLKEIERAYRFAEEHHAGQTRLSGEPFIQHPLSVARVLADLGLDTTTLQAALLHDTVEDTEVTLEQLEELFGSEVARIVDGLTKLESITFRSREQEQAENVRKMIVAMAGDIRVLLIKLADRLHNMRTIAPLPPEKQRRIATETIEIYAPLAHRLGVQQVKWELEDLSFKTLHPGPYREIANLVERRRGDRQEYVDGVLESARRRLRDAGVKADVEGRPKHLYSIYEKMVIGGKEFNEIYDLAGIRILVDSIRDCYGALGRGPLAVEAGPRPLQGLRGDAQVEHVPVAAHDGGGTTGAGDRGPAADPRDAPHGRVRHRGALAVQGRSRRQEGEGGRRPRVAGADARVAEGHGRPSRVHGGPEDRPLRGAGLLLHAQGRRDESPRGRHARGLRLLDPHRGRPSDDRREGERQAGAARLRAADGRHGGDPHVEGAGRGAVAGLAPVRQDAPGAQQGPAVVQPGAAGGRPRGGPRRAPAPHAPAERPVQAAGHRGRPEAARRRDEVPHPGLALRGDGGGARVTAVGGGPADAQRPGDSPRRTSPRSPWPGRSGSRRT